MANKIEGLIVKIKDTVPSLKGNFSIGKIQLYSNETPLVAITNYTSGMTTLKALKDYYEVDGKTYKMMKSVFSQSPNFTMTNGYQYQIVPQQWTDAKPSQIQSTAVTLGTFTPLTNASLRLKLEGALTNSFEVKATTKEEAIEKLMIEKKANVFIANDKIKNLKLNQVNLYENDEQLTCYSPKFSDGKLVSYKEMKVNKKDLLNKYILFEEDGKYKAIANNVHYKEVNGINFSACNDLDDVVDVLNSKGFNVKFELTEISSQKYILIKTKALGTTLSLTVETSISPDVVVDLKNVCFGGPTSATCTTASLTANLSNLIAVGDGKLTIEVDGTAQTRYNFDFTSCTTLDNIVSQLTLGANTTKGTSPVVKTPFTGVTFEATADKIIIKTTATGSTHTVKLLTTLTSEAKVSKVKQAENPSLKNVKVKSVANAEEDLYGTTLLNGANSTTASGSNGAVSTDGTDGAGQSIIDLYQAYDIYPDFMGSVLTTTSKMSLKNIHDLNSNLASSAADGYRICMVLTIQDPYECEATAYGSLLDWLDTRYLSLYCGGFTGIDDLELRAGVLSIGVSQDTVNIGTNCVKYDMHMKDIVIDDAKITDISYDNTIMELVNESGCGGCGYFKQGFGWKLTIPSGEGQFTFADCVTMQNIAQSFAITLANALTTNRYTNKTNQTIKTLHNILYSKCRILANNGVLTGDIKDFSSVPYNVEDAKSSIKGPDHAYIYSPDVADISGKKIPITIYFGFAQGIYGFELENVYLV